MEINAIANNGNHSSALETASESLERVSCVSVPTALYRHWDAEGNLLYVGISLSPLVRLCQHRDASAWYSAIATVTVAWFDSREQAAEAEVVAIKTEGPKHNVVHRPRSRSAYLDHLEDMAEDSCAELTRKVTRFDATYTVAKAADTLGIGVGNLRLAIFHRDIPCYMASKTPVITGWALIAYMEALQAGAIHVRTRAKNEDGTYPPYPSAESLAEAVRRL